MKRIRMNKFLDVTLNIPMKMKLGNHLLCQYLFTYNLKLKFFSDSRDYRMSAEFKQVKFINSFQKRPFPMCRCPNWLQISTSFCLRCDSTSVKPSDSFLLPVLKNSYV